MCATGIIRELDVSVANSIAAGEVVDRPASAVKELCENAIDAGATSITVEIKKGGVGLIRVTDNGCGMAPDDVAVSIKRNATSKIRTKQDLNSIETLGFRGEALAAIAAVCRLRIITKQKGKTGVMLRADGGKIISVEETGASDGTTVMVEGLFSNVPARLKFLKKDSTEAAYVTSVCEKIALSNPDVAVSLIIDGEMKFSTSACKDFKSVIYAVLGRDFANNMIPVKFTDTGITVSGYLGAPITARSNRNGQIFFCNGRYIKSNVIQAAVAEACVSYIPKEKFACAVLDIGLHPAYVDVNVHPAKLEVRFSNEKIIFDTVYRGVKTAIMQNTKKPELDTSVLAETKYRVSESFLPVDEKRPTVQERQISIEPSEIPAKNVGAETVIAQKPTEAPLTEKVNVTQPAQTELFRTVNDAVNVEASFAAPKSESGRIEIPTFRSELEGSVPNERLSSPGFKQVAEFIKQQQASKREQEPEEQKVLRDYRYIGELFGTYLVVEVGDDAYIIDKHAAHERLLFEKLKKRLGERDRGVQVLMLPIEIRLTNSEAACLSEYGDEITSSGYGYTLDGVNVSVTQIPSELTPSAAKDAFTALCSKLADGETDVGSDRRIRFERALYQSACKAAIKAGDINDRGTLLALVSELMSKPDVTYCPHGRPVAFVIKKSSLEHRFGRD